MVVSMSQDDDLLDSHLFTWLGVIIAIVVILLAITTAYIIVHFTH
jgi:hypothetical protein